MTTSLADLKLPYITSTKAKGKRYFYYRRGGVKQPIRGETMAELVQEYGRIHATFSTGKNATGKAAHGSVEWLVTEYLKSPEYKRLGEDATYEYRYYADLFRDIFQSTPVDQLTFKLMRQARDGFEATPAKANNFIKVVRRVLNYAIQIEEVIRFNPAAGMKKLETGSGWKAWPKDKLAEAHDKLTGSSRTAFYLALYLGQRKKDVLRMRWDQIDDGMIQVRQSKTGKELWLPLHPFLAEELERVQAERAAINTLSIVSRRDGKQLTKGGFNRIWRRQQAAHGFKGLQFHGLRRNAVNAMLEAGCEVPEVASITGQSFEMVAHYAQEVDQKMLARRAMNKLKTSSAKPGAKLSIIDGGKDKQDFEKAS